MKGFAKWFEPLNVFVSVSVPVIFFPHEPKGWAGHDQVNGFVRNGRRKKRKGVAQIDFPVPSVEEKLRRFILRQFRNALLRGRFNGFLFQRSSVSQRHS